MRSGRWRRGWGFVVIVTMAMIGCKPDPSEKSLQECEAMQAAGEVDKAWDACSAAVRLSPASKAAETASAKLRDLGPAHEKLEKERAEARAKAAEARAKAAEAEKAAQAARLAALRKKVTRSGGGTSRTGNVRRRGCRRSG
jgi:hypothetical protein